MTGKFASLRDAVVYRATLDGFGDTLGDVDTYGFHATRVEDFYGFDYVVIEDSQGFVTVERFDDIDIGPVGYFHPARDRWAELQREIEQMDAEAREHDARPLSSAQRLTD